MKKEEQLTFPPNTIDITKLDVKELKSLAYDALVVIEMNQKNLQLINQEIAKRNQPEEVVEPELEKKKD